MELESCNIKETNDRLRRLLPDIPLPHKLILTEGVAGMGVAELNRVLALVRSYDDFTEENDPYLEHDCIFIEDLICKIDYLDDKYEGLKIDGNRVFTIMYRNEY